MKLGHIGRMDGVAGTATLLCLLALTSQCSAEMDLKSESSDIVETSLGPVKGYSYTSRWTAKPYYLFQGIPYAAPPIGELRFKDPIPPKSWTAPIDRSFDDVPSCMQLSDTIIGYTNITFKMSEDCLYLNVYTPKEARRGAPLPVMVWVHGGAFLEGSGSFFRYDPGFLLGENVIVVTLNYRLGALGFLSLGTRNCPGNAGLKDQQFALQWVQREIRAFGGDPGNVTLAGESAGSASVHLHYLSPLSKGLFQRVIGESGTALGQWAVREDAHIYGQQLAKLLNCTSYDLDIIAKCLRKAKAEDIVAAQFQVRAPSNGKPEDKGDTANSLIFIPCVDKDFSDKPFIPETPARLIEHKLGSHVPFLMGINSDEGMMMLAMSNNEQISNITKHLDKMIPRDIRKKSSESRIQFLAERLKNFYFKTPPSKTNLRGYVDLYTDTMFGYSTAVSAKVYRKRAPVYLYYFSFNGKFKEIFTTYIEKKYNFTGVSHAEEMSYIFGRIKVNQEAAGDSNEMKTWRRMVRMWTNFVKFGKPTVGNDTLLQDVEWKPVGNVATKFLHIDVNLTMVEKDFLADRVALWDSMTPSSSSFVQSTGLLVALGVAVYTWATVRQQD